MENLRRGDFEHGVVVLWVYQLHKSLGYIAEVSLDVGRRQLLELLEDFGRLEDLTVEVLGLAEDLFERMSRISLAYIEKIGHQDSVGH